MSFETCKYFFCGKNVLENVLVALFHEITMNGNRGFKLKKEHQKHHKGISKVVNMTHVFYFKSSKVIK